MHFLFAVQALSEIYRSIIVTVRKTAGHLRDFIDLFTSVGFFVEVINSESLLNLNKRGRSLFESSPGNNSAYAALHLFYVSEYQAMSTIGLREYSITQLTAS